MHYVMDQSGIAVAAATGLAADSLNTSRSQKDWTVSLYFPPKPLHSPHPLSSYFALPSSRSLFKNKDGGSLSSIPTTVETGK